MPKNLKFFLLTIFVLFCKEKEIIQEQDLKESIHFSEEINLDKDNFTIVRFLENYNNPNEIISYHFNFTKPLKIEVSFINNGKGEGNFKIQKDSQEGECVFGQSLIKDNYFLYQPPREQLGKIYYISFYHSEEYSILIKFLLTEYEFHLLEINSNKNKQFFVFYSFRESIIYSVVYLDDINDNSDLFIKVIREYNNINEFDKEIFYYEEQNIDNIFIENIFSVSYHKLNCINESKNISVCQYPKNNKKLLFLKINFNISNDWGLKKIFVSLIKEKVLNTLVFTNLISKYSGEFITIDLTNEKNNNKTFFIYTSSGFVLDIVGFNQEQKSLYNFGKTNYDKELFIKHEKKSIINCSEILYENNNIKYISFLLPLSNENVFIYISSLTQGDSDLKLNKYDKRNERIFFYEKDINQNGEEFEINEYDVFGQKYMTYYEVLFGKVNISLCELYLEDNKSYENQDFFKTPQITKGKHEVIKYEGEGHIIYQKYNIKCKSYNGTTIEEGSFLQICLEPGEETYINMFSENIAYSIKLIIDPFTKDIYLIEVNDSNENFYFNNTFNKKNVYYEYPNKNNIIHIKNIGKFTSLINLKIPVPDKDIYIVSNSKKKITLEMNFIYVLLLPSKVDEGELYGLYQELKIGNNWADICIFREWTKKEYIAFPPNITCKNYSKGTYNLNLTIFNIKGYKESKDNSDNIDFYTYIYIKEISKNEFPNITLFYKHVVLSEFYLFNSQRNSIKSSNNIVLFEATNYNMSKKYDKLFMQLIRKELTHKKTIFILAEIINKKREIKFEEINIYNLENNFIQSEIISLNYSSNLVFKFYEPEESYFYFELGNSSENSFCYELISDKSISIIFNSESNDYILDFKPLEKNGIANYYIYLLKDEINNMTILNNPFNLLQNEYKFNYLLKYEKIISTNGKFINENIFSLKEKYNERKFNYIHIIANKTKPNLNKYYNLLAIDFNDIYIPSSSYYNYYYYDILEKTKCFDLKIEEHSVIFTIDITESTSNGSFIIQINSNNNISNKSNFSVFQSKFGISEIIYSISPAKSFLINSTKINKIFDIKYQNENDNINKVKICVEYIPFSGKSFYEESELKYQYISEAILPYYVNTTNFCSDLEIFKFDFNYENILDLNINVNYYDKYGNIIIKKTYIKNELINFEDKYFLGIYSSESKESIYIEIKLILENQQKFLNLSGLFIISRIKSNKLSLNNNIVKIGKENLFYFLELSDIQKNKDLLLYTNLNKNIVIIRNTSFNHSPEKISDKLKVVNRTNIKNPVSDNNKDLLIFITYSKKKEAEGFIDFSLEDKDTFTIYYNKNRSSLYNREINLNESNPKNKYYIIYNSNPKKIYTFSYDINDTDKNLVIYYNNDTSKNSINDFISALKIEEKEVKKNTTILLQGEIDIFAYEYNNSNMNKSLKITLKSELYEDERGKGIGARIFSLSILFLYLLLTGYIFYIQTNKNQVNAEDIEKCNTFKENMELFS